MVQPNIVTIDGPSASGKTTLCQRAALRLQWDWLSTGVFYRALAYIIIKENLTAPQQWSQCLKEKSLEIKKGRDQTSFWFKGRDLSSKIYNDQIDRKSSEIASLASVRNILTPYQREQKDPHRGLLAEGRDCGTVIFPKAPLKIYLTAKDDVRAGRRAKERNKTLSAVMSAQLKRDQFDSKRTLHPLQIPKGAWLINSDKYSLDEIEDKVCQKIKKVFSI